MLTTAMGEKVTKDSTVGLADVHQAKSYASQVSRMSTSAKVALGALSGLLGLACLCWYRPQLQIKAVELSAPLVVSLVSYLNDAALRGHCLL